MAFTSRLQNNENALLPHPITHSPANEDPVIPLVNLPKSEDVKSRGIRCTTCAQFVTSLGDSRAYCCKKCCHYIKAHQKGTSHCCPSDKCGGKKKIIECPTNYLSNHKDEKIVEKKKHYPQSASWKQVREQYSIDEILCGGPEVINELLKKSTASYKAPKENHSRTPLDLTNQIYDDLYRQQRNDCAQNVKY